MYTILYNNTECHHFIRWSVTITHTNELDWWKTTNRQYARLKIFRSTISMINSKENFSNYDAFVFVHSRVVVRHICHPAFDINDISWSLMRVLFIVCPIFTQSMANCQHHIVRCIGNEHILASCAFHFFYIRFATYRWNTCVYVLMDISSSLSKQHTKCTAMHSFNIFFSISFISFSLSLFHVDLCV